jgi:multicomponent Na+:H+ antiporter subunit B
VSKPFRLGLFAAAAPGVAAVLAYGFGGLPDFGHYAGPYGNLLVSLAPHERHITNIVAAVTFDYRGIDTMGEELILVAAVIGTAILLRDTLERDVRGVVEATGSDALRLFGALLVPVLSLVALSVIAHGYLTPGGGFQGGVVASAAVVLVFLALDYRSFHELTRSDRWETVESAGAGCFIALGLLGLTAGHTFLANFLPHGTFKQLDSGGLVPLLNWASGLAIAGGLVLVYAEYVHEAIELRRRGRRP